MAPNDQPRTEITNAATGMERRLVVRILNHWRALAGERPFPSFSDLRPEAIPDMWPHCFVLDVEGHGGDPIIRWVGAEISRLSETPFEGCRISSLAKATLLAQATRYAGNVLARKVPISLGGEVEDSTDAVVKYRSVLLPMSDDGKTISGLLGAFNFRRFRAS